MPECKDPSPSWFTGHWRDWHRGHGCYQDDGKDRSNAAVVEIEQHRQNAATGYLTDAELAFLRTRTTSGDTLLVRALDELKARRTTGVPTPTPRQRMSIDERVDFLLAHSEELALRVDCPNEACAAKEGQPCTPYTHFIRVRDAIEEGHLAAAIDVHEARGRAT